MTERLSRRERRQAARALAKNKGQERVPDWITIEGAEILGAQRIQEAVRGALRWTSRFGQYGPLTIRPLDDVETLDLSTALEGKVMEKAESGLIVLNQYALQAEDTYNTVIHAMTHASEPSSPVYLPEPIPYFAGTELTDDNYDLIIGFQGLSPIIRLRKDNSELKFTYFSESMAERNASYFPEYQWRHPKYYAWGQLTRTYFPFDKFPNAHQLVPRSDVPSFVREVLHVPKDTPITGNHIARAILTYINVGNIMERMGRLILP